ncbi:SCO2522 family protein [Nocardia sp. NPDC060259]|uniref:SCO2522 family protein n=1 Tax=Nocardia sp. NPDC060259 TaxID=3347088 RepID=UPI003668045A
MGGAVYAESTASVRVEDVPLSHVSVEVGHFYMADLLNGEAPIAAQFRRVARLLDAFTAIARQDFAEAAGGASRVRASTCFLLDDYFQPDTDPRQVVPTLLRIAEESGVRIDYLASQAGCSRYLRRRHDEPRIPLAQMVADSIVAEPAPGSTGRRPPTAESGWLCNGERSSDHEPGQAMEVDYRPPVEFAARNHNIFLDVEMWRDRGTGHEVLWSAPFLAAVWQLLRLGMLRYEGKAVVDAEYWQPGHEWPARWADFPSVIRLRERAAPFAAFRSLSLLPQRYVGIEHAVRMILDHTRPDPDVVRLIAGHAREQGIAGTDDVTDRLSYFFLSGH